MLICLSLNMIWSSNFAHQKLSHLDSYTNNLLILLGSNHLLKPFAYNLYWTGISRRENLIYT